MKSGKYLELKSGLYCMHYESRDELIQKFVCKGKIPELNSGENNIKFTFESESNVSFRVLVS